MALFHKIGVIADNCGNRNFLPFWLLWAWTWPNDLHTWTWPIFPGDIPGVQIWTSYVKAFKTYCLTDRQTWLLCVPSQKLMLTIIIMMKIVQDMPSCFKMLHEWQRTDAWRELLDTVQMCMLCTVTCDKNVQVTPDNNDLLVQIMLYNLLQRVSCNLSFSRCVWHSLHGNRNLQLAHSPVYR